MKNFKILTVILIICIFLSACGGGAQECVHSVVIDSAVAATCLEDGKTEGRHCSICGEILVVQETVAATGHSLSEWLVVEAPTYTKDGRRARDCFNCDYVEDEALTNLSSKSALGSASSLSGKTLIVSIFASENTTRWDYSSATDKETQSLMREHLLAATDWLEKQCKSYGTKATFVADWNKYSDLYYSCSFGNQTMVRSDGGAYATQRDFINEHIKTYELLEKHEAQNIIYIFYFNTDETNKINSWSLSDRQGCLIEVINVFVRDDMSNGYYYMPASSFAHEILHSFGAYDLYYASSAIPQSYVDHCKATSSNDIMYTVSIGKSITQELTELDAYYVGLTDHCSLVDTYGLAKSSHFPEE